MALTLHPYRCCSAGDNPFTLSGLKGLTGGAFHWDAYAAALGVDLKGGTVNVPNPRFLQALGGFLRNASFLSKHRSQMAANGKYYSMTI